MSFVPSLKKNLLSASVMEDKGYAVEFKNQEILIRPKESSLESTQVMGIRQGNYTSYRVYLFEP